MKTTFINRNSGLFSKFGMVAAAAVVCGYWVSQILATNFVSDVVTGKSSVVVGALCFGIFGVLFVLHLIKPLSKMAAILGLGSFGVFIVAMAFLCAPGLYYPLSAGSALFISTVLGVAGITLDVSRCWRVTRTHNQTPDSPDNFVI